MSTNRWRVAIDGDRRNDPEAKTTAELAGLFGVSQATIYRRVMALVKAGAAKATTKYVKDGRGIARPVVAYVLLQAPTKKAA